jgi:hypothetical protein
LQRIYFYLLAEDLLPTYDLLGEDLSAQGGEDDTDAEHLRGARARVRARVRVKVGARVRASSRVRVRVRVRARVRASARARAVPRTS